MNDRLILRAASFASFMHADQSRKYSGDPYIVHPMRVAGWASLLSETSPEFVAAAWLHDTIEDCEVTEEILAHRFGSVVAGLVLEVTNPSRLHKHLPRRQRKAMDFEHLAGASVNAKRLKLLDRIDNVRDSAPADESYRRLLVGESIDLLAAVGTADHGLSALLRTELDKIDPDKEPA